jgi:ABC-2 type transport system ATP-binding protein
MSEPAEDYNYAIEIENLVKVYGELRAVDGISIRIKKGEIFAFLGPNGAGKTTTVEMVEGIRKPASGEIRIFGKPASKSRREIKERIGVLPQEFKSFERLTVRETLLYYQKLYKKRNDVDEIIKLMDLGDKRDEQYKNLSGGLKQRVGVAIALVNDPEIVFLDEPTTGLDPKARRDVWHAIEGLRGRGKTVFLTTHYMEEAEYLADSIAIIHKGKIIATGTTQQLIEKHGGSDSLVIRKCDEEKVKSLGIGFSKVQNGSVFMPLDDTRKVTDIMNMINDGRLECDGFEVRRSNLEEVFLNLTGSALVEEKEDKEEASE